MLIVCLLSNIFVIFLVLRKDRTNNVLLSQWIAERKATEEYISSLKTEYNSLKNKNNVLNKELKQLEKEYENSKQIKIDTVYTDSYFDELLKEFELQFRQYKNIDEQRDSISAPYKQQEITILATTASEGRRVN